MLSGNEKNVELGTENPQKQISNDVCEPNNELKNEEGNQLDDKIVEKDGILYLNGKVQPTEEEMENWIFRFVLFIVDHPWPFLIPLSAGLIALSVLFCLQVKLAAFGWASLPVDSPLRPAYEDSLYDFQSKGQTNMEVFLQTSPAISVRNESFVLALNAFCNELEKQAFVSGVKSMVRINRALNVTDYINIYANPYNPHNMMYSRQVLDPFFLTDLLEIARVSIGVNMLPSDPGLGKAVRFVRSLLKRSFVNGDGSSMLQASGVTGEAAIQTDTLDDIGRVLPSFLAVIGDNLIRILNFILK